MEYLFNERGKTKTNVVNIGLSFCVTAVGLMAFILLYSIGKSDGHMNGVDLSLGYIMLVGLFTFVFLSWFSIKPIKVAQSNTYLRMTDFMIEGVSHDVSVSNLTGIIKVHHEEMFKERIEDVSSVNYKKMQGEDVIIITMKSGKTYNIVGITKYRKFIDLYYSKIKF